jgi:hypothetical protein
MSGFNKVWLVVPLMCAVTAMATIANRSQEVDAEQYEALSSEVNWHKYNSDIKIFIKSAMSDEKISKREYSDILNMIMDQVGIYQSSISREPASDEARELAKAQLIKRLKSE